MPEENKDNKPSEKVPLSWVFLGIGAIIIMWALSSWWFK